MLKEMLHFQMNLTGIVSQTQILPCPPKMLYDRRVFSFFEVLGWKVVFGKTTHDDWVVGKIYFKLFLKVLL